ncbi:hypothetical protein TOTORO_00700 [Serratia phage vB_SmaS-Totoro]|nr:hypothetical protein TOTORO_00700 [Serratia phage vB_SmaS-Totoro]
MSKDLSQYFKPDAESTTKPDQAGDPLDSLFDGVDFDAVAERNNERAESGEDFVDDGDCEGCKI